MLTYLLVSHRRVYALDEVIRFNRNEDLSDLTKDESLIYRATMGGDWIYDNRVIARAEQSDIPRYLSSQDVKAVATILDEMTFADVFKCYAEYDMNNAHVYKFHPNQSGTRDDIFLAFELLRDVYLKASKIHAGLFHKLI